LNNRQTEALAELEAIRTEKEQVDEIFEEIQLLEMSEGFEDDLGTSDDDGEEEDKSKGKSGVKSNLIPFKIGDAFAHVTFEKAIELLEKEQNRLQSEIERLETQSQSGEDEMKKLKVDLYAKFGSNISKFARVHRSVIEAMLTMKPLKHRFRERLNGLSVAMYTIRHT
jgi:prefoldin subunit 4